MVRRRDRDDERAVRQFLGLPPGLQIGVVVAVLLFLLISGALRFVQSHGGMPEYSVAAPGAGGGENGAQVRPLIVCPDLLLGNPSGATADASNRDNFLMVKKYFTLSYNDSKGIPNWVSWRVTAADLGDAPRKRIFDPDETLPMGFYRVQSRDYSRGGFDRGHMCPHSDRGADQDMSFATFVMTNIIPQAPNVNEKAWAKLEDYCRELVRQGNHLFIVAGPVGEGGDGRDGPASRVGEGRVVVPAECFKIAVVVREGASDDLAAIDGGTRVIAVLMPNSQRVGDEWTPYLTSVGNIEAATGFRFFTNLPGGVAEVLRKKIDGGPVR